MEENIFEHSFKDQSYLVRKYLKAINKYNFKDQEDYIKFIIDQMTSIGNVLVEREEIPSWVIDIKDYRNNSEIVLFLTAFENVNWNNLRKKIPDLNPREFIQSLFFAARKYGERRGWDTNILHLQFSRLIGINIVNTMTNQVKPRNISGIGYN